MLVRPFEDETLPLQHAAVRTDDPRLGTLLSPQTMHGLGTLGTTNERESRGATPFPEGGPAY